MQDVEFFIDNVISDKTKQLMWLTHQLLCDSIPRVQASLKWKVPFYSLKKNICFLNPKPDYLIIGWIQGAALSNPHGLLVGEQKLIRHYIIRAEKDIFREELSWIINEAVMLDPSNKTR